MTFIWRIRIILDIYSKIHLRCHIFRADRVCNQWFEQMFPYRKLVQFLVMKSNDKHAHEHALFFGASASILPFGPNESRYHDENMPKLSFIVGCRLWSHTMSISFTICLRIQHNTGDLLDFHHHWLHCSDPTHFLICNNRALSVAIWLAESWPMPFRSCQGSSPRG